MSFRVYETNDYCNILNITYSILNVATNSPNYDKIPCINQNKEDICKNVKILFDTSYIIPIPNYVNIINVLQNSVMNVLECNKVEINHKFNYSIISFIMIIFMIYILLIRKLKNY